MAPVLRAYSVAAAAAAAAFLITRLVWPLIEPTRSPVFLAAVVVSAWYGGLGPGLFATAIAVLTKAHFFLPPMYPFDRDDLPALLYLLLFVLVGVLISTLTGALQRAATVDQRAARERAARAQAEADNRAKDVVLAKVSHEFTAADGRVDVRLERDDTTARIIVADTGCGMPPQMLPHLFREFWQGSRSGHRSPGLGLGLAIVRHLVELHGGTVRADSPGPGCGTTLVVELPLCLAASVGAARAIEQMDGQLDRPGVRHHDTIVGGVQEFLTGAPAADRVLTTVVFIDMVDSTRRTAELGDRGWRDVLERYHQLIRRLLERFRGREIDATGDGVFAVFDGPARAIQYASAVTHAVRDLGIDVRAGLHTGECQVVGEKLAGIAVHLGARVASLAKAGEVLVSTTVKDVVAGSGIAFEGRGTHILRGVPGEWPLFAVTLEAGAVMSQDG
jgi:class 3 adenylate cyclase